MTSSNETRDAREEAGRACNHCRAPIPQWWSARSSKGSVCGLCGSRVHFHACAPCPNSPWQDRPNQGPQESQGPQGPQELREPEEQERRGPEAGAGAGGPQDQEQQQAALFGNLP